MDKISKYSNEAINQARQGMEKALRELGFWKGNPLAGTSLFVPDFQSDLFILAFEDSFLRESADKGSPQQRLSRHLTYASGVGRSEPDLIKALLKSNRAVEASLRLSTPDIKKYVALYKTGRFVLRKHDGEKVTRNRSMVHNMRTKDDVYGVIRDDNTNPGWYRCKRKPVVLKSTETPQGHSSRTE